MGESISQRRCAKWILSGEHTVLRGGSSLLFPLKNFYFEISYQENLADFNVKLYLENNAHSSRNKEGFQNILKNVIQKAFDWIKKKPTGIFTLNYGIPLASGLGSSAAFCTALSKIFYQLEWIQEKDILELSLYLENEFHGKSSGADIQVVYHEKPLIFKSFTEVEFLQAKWKPYFCLHFTGILSHTQDCIQQVTSLIKKNPHLGMRIDERMKQSVHLSIQALKKDKTQGLPLLQQSMESALECFKEWGLCPPKVMNQIQELYSKGALAVKPTGSGGGGFLLSLWKEKPLESEDNILIQMP